MYEVDHSVSKKVVHVSSQSNYNTGYQEFIAVRMIPYNYHLISKQSIDHVDRGEERGGQHCEPQTFYNQDTR